MRTADEMQRVPGASDPQGARAARCERHDPLLRGLDAHPRSFEVAAKNLSAPTSSTSPPHLVGVEGRVADRHRAHHRGAGRRHARDAPLGVRRAVPRGRGVRRPDAQRRGRLARASRRRRCSTSTPCARGCRTARSTSARSSSWATCSTRGSRAPISGRSPRWAPMCGSAVRPRCSAGSRAGPRRGAAGRAFTVTSDLGAALRDADVVMALRIQKERMASGLLPSLREYAARYGLTRPAARGREARCARDAPGADERGRRDRAGRCDRPSLRGDGAGGQRRRDRMALLYLLAGARRAEGAA